MPRQLPPELLRPIVDDFRLPPLSSPRRTLKLEKETRSTLCSLSLTSHTFRQLAQPLLFDFVRIPKENNLNTISLLVGANAENDNLLLTRTVLLEEDYRTAGEREEEERSLRLFSKLSTRAEHIEQLIVDTDFHRFQSISASNLKRLFLSNLGLDVVPTMPSLQILGLYNVYIESNSRSQVADLFPSLRHLTFDNGEPEIYEEDAALLTRLASQLDSIVILSDIYSLVRSEASAVPIPSILVTLPWNWSDDFKNGTNSVVNLRLQISDIYAVHNGLSHNGLPVCSECISNLASRLDQYPQLETVYLPPIDSLPSKYCTEAVTSALHQFSFVCQNRNIEVIYEEQSDRIEGESQISEDFMRRMTRKRIEREAAAVAEDR